MVYSVVLFDEVPFEARPQQPRGHAQLPYQDHKSQSVIMACNHFAVLPSLWVDATGLV